MYLFLSGQALTFAVKLGLSLLHCIDIWKQDISNYFRDESSLKHRQNVWTFTKPSWVKANRTWSDLGWSKIWN